MASVIQFVDSIAASPGVRLDLNSLSSGLLMDTEGSIDLSPPPVERAFASTMLVDGDRIVASAYGNRTIKLTVRVSAGTGEAIQTIIQDLAQELDRTENVLKVQLDGMSSPVFFRTFRASDFVLAVVRGYLTLGLPTITLEIPAQPFGYGLQVAVTPVAISSDPGAGSNGKYMDITGVQGDVETPLQVRVAGSSVTAKQGLLAMRRGGTPSAMPFALQGESMTLGTDTGTTANTTYSGGTAANCSFATTTSSAIRVSTTVFPATPSVDVRGTYNVYGRLSSTTLGASFAAILQHGARAINNPEIVFTQSPVSIYQPMVDLGQIQLPEGYDPVIDGPSNNQLQVNGVPLKLYLRRVSATGTCQIDYLLFVPADDSTAIVNWGTSAPTTFVFDGTQRSVYGLDSSGRVADIAQAYFVGDPPYVSPNITNRLVFINDVSPINTTSDPVASAVTLSLFYWPRYLTIRPATT